MEKIEIEIDSRTKTGNLLTIARSGLQELMASSDEPRLDLEFAIKEINRLFRQVAIGQSVREIRPPRIPTSDQFVCEGCNRAVFLMTVSVLGHKDWAHVDTGMANCYHNKSIAKPIS